MAYLDEAAQGCRRSPACRIGPQPWILRYSAWGLATDPSVRRVRCSTSCTRADLFLLARPAFPTITRLSQDQFSPSKHGTPKTHGALIPINFAQFYGLTLCGPEPSPFRPDRGVRVAIGET